MTTQNKNIPALRFSEFNNEWEEKKLAEVSKINPSNRNLPDSFVYIDLESVENGILTKENHINLTGAPSRAQRLLEKNDILYQTVRPYQKNNLFFDRNGTYVASTGYAQIRTENDPKYLFQYLHTDYFVDKVLLRCTGTSYPAINSTDLSTIKLNIPSLPEQQKIAAFLTAVDEKIQQLTNKKDSLEQYKKGVMQKIFNQEIRFKDDNGNDFADWEEKNLGEVLFEPKQKAVENPSVIELLTVKLHCKGVVQTGNFPAVTRNARPYYKRFEDELLIGRQNFHNGGIGIVQKEQSGLICSNAISSYRVVNDNLKYIYYYITRPKYYKKAEDIMGGTGQKEISKNEFAKLKIDVPSFPEQKKIAVFLSAIDDKINLVNQQLEKTKEYKKGLLQKMFI